jgi:diaminopropionate ammonia-lyase
MNNFFINKPTNLLPKNCTTDILKNSSPLQFHKSLEAYKDTPLVSLPALAQSFSVGNIFIKDESHRFGLNAFKGLGASYAIHEMLKKNPLIKTFCTATDGNHGRAVAWSANRINKHSVVFVPRDASNYRIEAIKKEGANVLKVNGNYDDACAHAEAMSIKEGWQLMQDTAWDGYEEVPAYIMAGYLTHFIELECCLHETNSPEVDIVFLQAGVGSWAASAVWYYLNKYGANKPKLVVVEPTESDGILASFKNENRTAPEGNFETIMAGLNCGIPSSTAWEILQSGVNASMKIEDSCTMKAMRALYYPLQEDEQVIAGESGAAGLAGFMALMNDDKYATLKESLNINENTRILFFNTEGNTDPERFQKIIEKN